MIVDGRALAEVLKAEVRVEVEKLSSLTLAVIVNVSDAVTDSYVKIKKRVAGELGVTVVDCASVEEALVADGIILQLPLPPGMDVEREKNKIPIEKDVDVLSDAAFAAFSNGNHPAIPPVPAAMKYILEKNNTTIYGGKVGYGRLVGKPAAVLFKQLGAEVRVADKGDDVGAITRDADIVILGTGIAGVLKPDMVKDGVAILDAGASVDRRLPAGRQGKVVGDADPACADKASLFTPVPGGVGPVAIAEIFANLVALERHFRP